MTGRRADWGDDGFDLSAWLAVDSGAGTPAGGTTHATVGDGTGAGPPDPTDEGFAFAAWVTDGDDDLQLPDPAADDGPEPARSADDPPTVPYVLPRAYRPSVHPTRAATLALFLTAATLAVLSAGGVLPPLGPATGLPA